MEQQELHGMIISAFPGQHIYTPTTQEVFMYLETHYNNDLLVPYDYVIYIMIEDMETTSQFAIDGTGKLQITDTGGASAAEGGMGSSSDNEKEKGDLNQPLSGEKGGKANTDSDSGFDPVKENIDKATEKSKGDI
jgi:hypothetical protein